MNIRIATESDKPLVYALRFEVFVDEQKVPPEIELDAEDAHATHIIAESDGIAIGCARVILTENDAHIGRLAVKASFRSSGVGSAICKFIIDDCRERGIKHIWLNSQLHAVEFYRRLGFQPQGDIFTEAGIKHIQMSIDP